MLKPRIFPTDTDHKILANSFQKEGYLVIENFYHPDECRTLMQRMEELLMQCDINELGSTFAVDVPEQERASTNRDRYFRESGDKIRFFLEKDARFSVDCSPKELLRMLNKAGHALHDLDPVFSSFSRKPALAKLTKALGVTDPLLLQSMFIFKAPGIGGEVRSHQDSTYMYTEPESLLGFWVALEDATEENSCLFVGPGSHKERLRERLHYQNEELIMETIDPTPMATADVPLEVSQGTLVVLHGRVAHKSSANKSNKSRHAYTLHIIDGETEYLSDNWLRRGPDMPLRGF